MRNKLIVLALFSFSSLSLIGQSITGGAGITHVVGDPDDITLTQGVDIHESNICFDPTNQVVYFFNPAGSIGVNQWDGVSVGSFTNTDTRLTNPTVSSGNLVFDIFNVVTNANTGAQVSVPILSIAPVQDIQGGGDISVSDDGSGTYTISFSETNTSLTIAGSTLTYTDETGADNDVSLPESDGSETSVTAGGDISVAGTGTSADPYVVSFSETNTSLSISGSTLTYTDENGAGNTVSLPTYDGSETSVTAGGDIAVAGTGTSADPYVVSFSETNTSLSIDGSTLTYTDEAGADNDISLPESDGSETSVTAGGDISVAGTGTSADPYVVSFSETNTSLSISGSTLTYTDENGAGNTVSLPTYDGSETSVTAGGDIAVAGTGTSADPYVVSFSETNTSLSIDGSTLTYTDEAGADNDISLPESDGSETSVTAGGDIAVAGTGTSADPYVVSFSETNTSLSISGSTLTYTDENGAGNTVSLPTYDGSETSVTAGGDIAVAGTGTSADPYVVSFSETNTSLSIDGSTLTYTDEAGADNDISLPESDGSETSVTAGGDIAVAGTGTSADPYVVSFSETNTSLSISGNTLTYTDENGAGNTVSLPTYDGSETSVTAGGDIAVAGTGTSADPYVVSFSETNTSLSIDGNTLTYTDETGADNDISLPESDGSETSVTAGGDISVAGTGTSADPYVVSFSETNTSLSLSGSTLTYTDEMGTGNTVDLSSLQHVAATVEDGNTIDFTASGTDDQTITAEIAGSSDASTGQVPVSDGSGGITWSSATITSIAADSKGKLVATLTSGSTVVFDLDDAPRVDNMSDLDTAAAALSSGETGIAVADDGNSLGLPAKESSAAEIGVLFFIKKK